jgi:hypothetical protein
MYEDERHGLYAYGSKQHPVWDRTGMYLGVLFLRSMALWSLLLKTRYELVWRHETAYLEFLTTNEWSGLGRRNFIYFV